MLQDELFSTSDTIPPSRYSDGPFQIVEQLWCDFSLEAARPNRYVGSPDAEDFLRSVAFTCKARLRCVAPRTLCVTFND
jgi:hypothetical protein